MAAAIEVVLVTHSPRVAAFADRVYFLKDGDIVDQAHLGGKLSLGPSGRVWA